MSHLIFTFHCLINIKTSTLVVWIWRRTSLYKAAFSRDIQLWCLKQDIISSVSLHHHPNYQLGHLQPATAVSLVSLLNIYTTEQHNTRPDLNPNGSSLCSHYTPWLLVSSCFPEIKTCGEKLIRRKLPAALRDLFPSFTDLVYRYQSPWLPPCWGFSGWWFWRERWEWRGRVFFSGSSGGWLDCRESGLSSCSGHCLGHQHLFTQQTHTHTHTPRSNQ